MGSECVKVVSMIQKAVEKDRRRCLVSWWEKTNVWLCCCEKERDLGGERDGEFIDDEATTS